MFLQVFGTLADPDHIMIFAIGLVVEFLVLAGLLVPQRWDLARLRSDLQQLKQASYLDPLTGLRSGALFQSELAELGRQARSVVLLYIDLDNFALFNEGGHRASGDQALRRAADTLRKSIRRGGDRLYRLHGDEFVSVLLNASEEQAEDCARLMLSSLATERLSATIGGAASQRVGWQQLEHVADKACGAQKKRAKGSYLFATPELARQWFPQPAPLGLGTVDGALVQR